MLSDPLGYVQQRVPLLRELPREVTGISAIAFFVALGFGIVAFQLLLANLVSVRSLPHQ